jgi:hypothetical protein
MVAQEHYVILVGEESYELNWQLESTVIPVADHTCRCLAAQPLQHPPLVEPRAGGQVRACHGPGILKRSVEAKPKPKADHDGNVGTHHDVYQTFNWRRPSR